MSAWPTSVRSVGIGRAICRADTSFLACLVRVRVTVRVRVRVRVRVS